jgi:hypothetical protein
VWFTLLGQSHVQALLGVLGGLATNARLQREHPQLRASRTYMPCYVLLHCTVLCDAFLHAAICTL